MATVKRRYYDVARSSLGGVIGSPTVTVYDAGTTTVSTIYSDGSGTAKSNPFTGDADGLFEFFVDPGDYKVRVEKVGYSAFEVDNVEIGYEHSELGSLSVDDHPQYLLLAGRVGGQTVAGTLTVEDVLTSNEEVALDVDGVGTVRIRPHVGARGPTLRSTVDDSIVLSLFRQAAGAGVKEIAVFRGEATSDLPASYDAGGLIVEQQANTDGAEQTRLYLKNCQGGANPVIAVTIHETNGRVGIRELTPDESLHILTESGSPDGVKVEAADGSNVFYELMNTSGRWRIQLLGADLQVVQLGGGNTVMTIASGAPASSLAISASGYVSLLGGLRLTGYTSAAADPTTTQLPANKDACIHKNTSSGSIFLAVNDGGVIKKVALT